jgi:hypothetical protein
MGITMNFRLGTFEYRPESSSDDEGPQRVYLMEHMDTNADPWTYRSLQKSPLETNKNIANPCIVTTTTQCEYFNYSRK